MEEVERGSRRWRDAGESSSGSTTMVATGGGVDGAGAPTPTTPPPPQPSASRDGRLKPPRDASGGHGLVSKGDTK